MHLVYRVVQLFGCGSCCSGADCEPCESSCKQTYRNGNNSCGVHAHSSVECYCFCSCNIQLSTKHSINDLLRRKLAFQRRALYCSRSLSVSEHSDLQSSGLPACNHFCQHIRGLESDDGSGNTGDCRGNKVDVFEQQRQRSRNKIPDNFCSFVYFTGISNV